MKRILISATLLGGLLAISPQAMTAPEPFDVPTTWELDFEFKAPQSISLILPGQRKPTTFWYMLYSVTNMTRSLETGRGADQAFYPSFTMYTDTGETTLSDRRLSARVFAAIKKRHNNPLLKENSRILGKLLYGKDNAKDGVAIWPDFDAKTGSFDIFVGGLSGETAELKLPRPVTVTETDNEGNEVTSVKYKVVLHKSLNLNFEVKGGDTTSRKYTTTKLASKKWVLR